MELSEHARVNRNAWNEKASGDIALAERQWAARRDHLGHLERARDARSARCRTSTARTWSSSGAEPRTCRRGWPRTGARPVGVDLSENQLATARAMQAEHGLEFPLHHASAEDVPLPDDCADFVISEYGA